MLEVTQAKATLGEEFSLFIDIILPCVENLGLRKGARILDVGTGKGRAAVTLALMGYRVLTGEPADDHSAYAKQAWHEAARKVGAEDSITYRAFDAARMPFEDRAFDAVFMVGALHHMADPARAVAECSRVLAANGVVCILEPTEKLLEKARAKFPNHPEPVDPRPFAGTMAVAVSRTEMFDIYEMRLRV